MMTKSGEISAFVNVICCHYHRGDEGMSWIRLLSLHRFG